MSKNIILVTRSVSTLSGLISIAIIAVIGWRDVSIDSIARFQSAQAIYDGFPDTLYLGLSLQEPLSLLIALVSPNVEVYQLATILVAVFIGTFGQKIHPVWLLLWVLTPPGGLLFTNITEFFIAALLVFGVTNSFLENRASIKKVAPTVLLAFCFHWMAPVLLVIDYFATRSYSSVKPRTLVLVSFGILLMLYPGLMILMPKLVHYESVQSGNPIHLIYLGVALLYLPFLQSLEARERCYYRRIIFVLSVSVLASVLISLKVGSRVSFYADVVLMIWIFGLLRIGFIQALRGHANHRLERNELAALR